MAVLGYFTFDQAFEFIVSFDKISSKNCLAFLVFYDWGGHEAKFSFMLTSYLIFYLPPIVSFSLDTILNVVVNKLQWSSIIISCLKNPSKGGILHFAKP